MDFSVIIATHNRDKLLARAINSAINQTYSPKEIFIVDDIPLSSTKNAISSISNQYSIPISYLENIAGRGAPSSRNLGANKASAQYLAFLDDDDFWANDYLESAARVIQDKMVDIVLTGVTAIDINNKKTKGKTPPEVYVKENFYLKNPGVLASNFIVRKKKFDLIKGYDTKLIGSEDKELFMRLMDINCSYSVMKHKELVYWWTGHDDQFSKNHWRLLPTVFNLYLKYFKKLSLPLHIKMLYKLFKLLIFPFLIKLRIKQI